MNARIAVIGAGGTIAMQGAHPFDWVDYGDSGVVRPVDQVVAGMDFGLPGIQAVPVPFRMLPGTGIAPADWLDLRHEIGAVAAAGEFDGIVVTHGTATLEETAFFLHLTLAPALPVVICGAQRPPNTASSDAVAGLRNAVAAAARAPAGVHVVMNGLLYSPEDVTKTANHALDAFEAPEFGPLGRVEADGTLSLPRLPASGGTPFAGFVVGPEGLPRVDIAYSYSGADGAAVDAFVQVGARAIISAGFAPGRCTPAERAGLLRAVQCGVVVVQCSRALRGSVPEQPYNVAAGILGGGSHSPAKARILTMLALAAGLDADALQSLLQGRPGVAVGLRKSIHCRPTIPSGGQRLRPATADLRQDAGTSVCRAAFQQK